MYLENITGASFKDWRENKNVAISVSKKIEQVLWERSFWEPFFGQGQNRLLMSFLTGKAEPKRLRLKMPLINQGARGNADFETARDHLEIFGQSMFPEIYKLSMRSDDLLFEDIKDIDFIAEASESLTAWLIQTRDRCIHAAAANNPTNIVVCDKANGVKDVSKDEDVVTAVKKVSKGDVMSVKALRTAILMAKRGKAYSGTDILPIRPAMANKIVENKHNIWHESYYIFLDSYAAEQLKADKEWQDMQKHAAARGEANRLFTGLLGVIDGSFVFEMPVWSLAQAGMVNSTISRAEVSPYLKGFNSGEITDPQSFKGTDTETCQSLLFGANALAMMGADHTALTINDKADIGTKIEVGIRKLMAVSKIRYGEMENEKFAKMQGFDIGAISIFSSLE